MMHGPDGAERFPAGAYDQEKRGETTAVPDPDRTESSRGPRARLPRWLRVPLRGAAERRRVRRILEDLKLNTVCSAAVCPNLCDCWARGTATFLILGPRCTRSCRFCAVPSGRVSPPDPEEPERVAEAAVRLGLRYVVVTSVTRDDLPDGGAGAFAQTIRAIRRRLPDAGVEVLVPDFKGNLHALRTVLEARPDVFNHNIETCRRLTACIRPQADYDRSLSVLSAAGALAPDLPVKSGFMLGLGESGREVREMLNDLRRAGVSIVTIGQYLAPPVSRAWPVVRFVPPAEFSYWRKVAIEDFGFRFVAAAPHVRSSYQAETAAASARTESSSLDATE